MKKFFAAAITFALIGLTGSAQAALVTSLPGAVAISMPEINLSPSQGPQALAPGITWSSNSPEAAFGWTAGWGFGSNGYWSGLALIGVNDPFATMTLSFATPVTGFAGLFNYAPNSAWTASISVFDSTHTLIETKILSHLNGQGAIDQGEYLGFLESTPSISYFTMSGAYIAGANFTILGNPVAAVPEPETYAMMLAGLGLMGFVARRRKQV